MSFNFFEKLFPKKFLGIDIGISAVKVVEISKWGGGRTLENYGLIQTKSLFKEKFRTFEKTTLLVSPTYVSRAIKAVIREAKIKTKAAIFSIPDFSTFFVTFELPPMEENEIPKAIRYTAPQYLPLPIGEVTLDWRLIEGRVIASGQKGTKLKVLVVAIPNDIISQYQMLAKMANLQLYALESEVFGLVRSSVKEKEKMVCLIDLGAHSSTVNIVDKGILKKSYSLKFSSNSLTYAISKSLDMEYSMAKNLKEKYGLLSSKENIAEVLYPFLDLFLREVRNIFHQISESEEKEVEKIFLVGGGAKLPGLKAYFSEVLKKEIEISNPFADFLYPPVLGETLKELGPIFGAAVGMALEGLEQI